MRSMIESLFRTTSRWSLIAVVLGWASLVLVVFPVPGYRIILPVIIIPILAINFASVAVLIWRGRNGTETIDLFLSDASYLKSWAVFVLPMQIFLGMISLLDSTNNIHELFITVIGFLLGCSMATGPGVYFMLWYIKKNGVIDIIRRS